jgi:hypothetical protein
VAQLLPRSIVVEYPQSHCKKNSKSTTAQHESAPQNGLRLVRFYFWGSVISDVLLKQSEVLNAIFFDTDATFNDRAEFKGRITMDCGVGINIFDADATFNDQAEFKCRITMDCGVGINKNSNPV